MFANIRKECFLHFMGMTDISVIVSNINGNAKLFVYLGGCNNALTSREYPTAELLRFCETYFKGVYQVNGVPKEKAQKAAWEAQPITAEFLRRNFNGGSNAEDKPLQGISSRYTIFATRRGQTAISVDVFFRREGDATVVIYGEPCDNVLNVHTVGELITFLNLCGLNDFVSELKILDA